MGPTMTWISPEEWERSLESSEREKDEEEEEAIVWVLGMRRKKTRLIPYL